MNNPSDTIAAIATAAGEGGICIIRISGPDSLKIVDRLVQCAGARPSERPAGSFLHGRFRATGDEFIDEIIVLIYRAPHSYTREDVVEIQGHGGRVCARRILQEVLNAGARSAEPGEFTRRAFLNGRLDLLQAEAVLDLIRAQSDWAAAAALEQLEGRLSQTLSSIFDQLVGIAADIEATLDFPEEALPVSTFDDLSRRLVEIAGTLNANLSTWNEGHLIREGAIVVISGRPNVGKSSLLNALLGIERAIVTEIPGTTRDTIEEQMVIGGVPMRLVDTAGIRETDCVVERHGIRRTRASVSRADLNLYVVDSSMPLQTEDVSCVEQLDPTRCIIILNKSDLMSQLPSDAFGRYDSIACSSTTLAGVQTLSECIVKKLGISLTNHSHAVISERHRYIIQSVVSYVATAQCVIDTHDDSMIAPAASGLREAISELGTITGKIYTEALLDNIFSRFCVGK